MPLPSVVIVYVRCFSLSFEFELSQSLDQSPNFPLHSLSSLHKPYVAKEPKSYAIFKAIWGRITADGCLGSMTIATNHIDETTHLKLVNVDPMYMEKYSHKNRKSKCIFVFQLQEFKK